MDESLNHVFAALADPTRRAMLARLAKGEASVKELAGPFDLTQPAISKHLKVLETAGLVTAGKTAQVRPRRLNAERLKAAHAWIEQFRTFWPDSFDRLDSFLKSTTDTAKDKSHDGP